jgi:hypothetical protein
MGEMGIPQSVTFDVPAFAGGRSLGGGKDIPFLLCRNNLQLYPPWMG